MNQVGMFLLGIAVFCVASVSGRESFEDFHSRSGVIYKQVGDEKLDMTLILPEVAEGEKVPVMLYTHGGGWGKGDKTKVFGPASAEALRILYDQGIACAAIVAPVP